MIDNDNLLLEKAAKAAGLDIQWQDDKPHIGDWMSRNWWNPLTDDGDALRLAVKLKMVIEFYETYVYVYYAMSDKTFKEFYQGEPYAASRRAIVRAAAEIGKAMV